MANLADKRWMQIDESSEDVHYTGPWFVDSYDQPGPFRAIGSLSGQSAHGIVAAGGFSFSFEGTDFDVRGQSSVILPSTSSIVRCTIDGVDGNTDVADAANFRNFRLCFGRNLAAGPHTVSVQITANENTVIWVDTVVYYSLTYPNMRRKQSQLTPDTPEFEYKGSGWWNPFDEKGTHGRQTYSNGDRAIIPFFGTWIELWSYLTPDMPRTAGAASYSVDGGLPVRLELPMWTPGFRGSGVNDVIWTRLIRTPLLPPGNHTLELVNLGAQNTVPLAIDYFLISHGDVDNPMESPERPGQVITTSTIPFATTTSTTLATSSLQKTAVGPIVGGIAGGIVAVAGIALLIYFCLSRRRKSGTDEPPNRLTIEETAGLLMSSRDPAVATSPYNAEPTPNTFDGTPSLLPPQSFLTPAQTVMDAALRATDTKRKPLPAMVPPPPPVQEPPQRLSREYADSMASLYTNSPPRRLVPLRRESDNGQSLLATSPTSLLPGSSFPATSVTLVEDERAIKKGFLQRLHTTN